MKSVEWGSQERIATTPERSVPNPEQARETVSQARLALTKANELLGSDRPKTSAEQVLSARRLRLTTWMKRFSLIGALATSATGLKMGAERLGDIAQEGAVQTGHAIRALGDIRPAEVTFEAPTNTAETLPMPLPELLSTPSSESPLAITINDPEDAGADATVHEESEFDREQRILRESSLLVADQLESEGFFEHDQTASGFEGAVAARLAAMGITGDGPLETAQRIIINQYKETVREHAQHDVEGALRMANRVNSAFGGIDIYALALEHNRPDLAAETASNMITDYHTGLNEIRTASDYDDADERNDAMERSRYELLRDLFPAEHASGTPEVLRHLDQNQRHEVASAIDAQVTSLRGELTEEGMSDYRRDQIREELERLQAERGLL